MYVLHNKAHNALRALAMLVVVTLSLWAFSAAPFFQKANAANVTSFSDTLSDSDLGVGSNHTISFTVPNGLSAGQTIVITFPTSPDNFVLPVGLDFGDVDITDDGVDQTLAASNGAAQWGVATTATTMTLTSPSGSSVSSSSLIVIQIGTNATFGTTGDTQITNPDTAGSYEISVGGTMQDTGRTRVAILDNVVVTAAVNTSFTFTVIGLATSTEVNGTTTTRTSTATAIPFGTLTNGVIETLAQDLTVTTNAAYGFAVTVEQDSNLLSSTGADIDGFANGTYTNTPASWTAPSNSISSENTWGHWGLTSEDGDLNSDEFGSNLWVSASTTPRIIFSHASSSNGVTPNIGSTTVGYQAQITALQEAGDDYTTTLTYIATPTF
jgi:hypothetical protein